MLKSWLVFSWNRKMGHPKVIYLLVFIWGFNVTISRRCVIACTRCLLVEFVWGSRVVVILFYIMTRCPINLFVKWYILVYGESPIKWSITQLYWPAFKQIIIVQLPTSSWTTCSCSLVLKISCTSSSSFQSQCRINSGSPPCMQNPGSMMQDALDTKSLQVGPS